MTKAERRTHWQTLIEKQTASGISAAAYCREGQIQPALFYSWRRRLREQPPCSGGFLELIPEEAAPSGIRVRMGEKLAIEVDRGFDPFTLRAVVKTFGNLS